MTRASGRKPGSGTRRGRAAAPEARLARTLRASWLSLWAERLAQAFWLAFSVLCLGLAVHGMGLVFIAPAAVLAALWGTLGFLFLLAVGLGVRAFRRPTSGDVRARLDAGSEARPLASLEEVLELGRGDPGAEALWVRHRARLLAEAARLRPVPPRPALAARDPFGLRLAALFALAVAAVFGNGWQNPPGAGGLGLDGRAVGMAGPAWEGWVEPPRYTGLPTLYLNDLVGEPLEVPAGSVATFRLYDGKRLSIDQTVAVAEPEPASGDGPTLPGAAGAPVAITLEHDGRLAVRGADVAWDVTVVPDLPPEVMPDGRPTRSEGDRLTLPFRAMDDYGVVAGTARIELDTDSIERRHGLAVEPEPRPPVTVDLPMPFAGERSDFVEDLVVDLNDHPWVGLPVIITLEVTDGAGQVGRSAPVTTVLPGRRFFDSLAAVIAEQRRDLLWSRANARRVAGLLRAVTHRPEEIAPNPRAYLLVRVAVRRLETALAAAEEPIAADTRDEVAALLWRAAVLQDEGDLADALAWLRQAEKELAEAIRRGAPDDEIAELTDRLREAMENYLRELARQEPSEDGIDQAQGGANEITSDDLQAMLDEIERLMREGRTAEAEALLEQLRRMMENMRVTRREGGEGTNAPGEQALEDMREALRQQEGLSDEAFRELQEQFNGTPQRGERQGNRGRNGGLGQGQSHEGQNGQGEGKGDRPGARPGGERGKAPSAGDLAERQRRLAEEARRLERGLPGTGSEEGEAARDALDRAGRAMDEAADALGDGRLADALDDQADAMEALREGMRRLGDALADEEMGQGRRTGEGRGTPENARDPLGRDAGTRGRIGSNEDLPDGADLRRRARELMDEIRRRAAERDRPEEERDYLERLLDQF